VLALLPAGLVVRALLERRLAFGWAPVALVSFALLLPLEDELIALARHLSAGTGAAASGLAPLPTLITLVPSLGVLGLAVLAATAVDRCEVSPHSNVQQSN
jgi:hypothetical protein